VVATNNGKETAVVQVLNVQFTQKQQGGNISLKCLKKFGE